MATVIRLKRGGRTHKPYYRIVVMDSRNRVRGREVDILGYYQPCARPEPLTEIDVHRALHWLRNGVEISETVRAILRRTGIMKHFAAGTTPEAQSIRIVGDRLEEIKGPVTAPAETQPAGEAAAVGAEA
jgi:small subunit ribosomal protein S16